MLVFLWLRRYTGAGESLDDYRCHSTSSSESDDELPRSPPRHALSGPAGSGDGSPGAAADEGPFSGWGPAAAEASAERGSTAAQYGEPVASFAARGKRALTALPPSEHPPHLPRSLRWFERHKEVIYADSLGLDQFLDLVRCLQASRRALLGGEGIVAPDEEIATVFLPLASEMPDGSRRMMLNDFKSAVRTSPRFLCLLGVAYSHIPSPSFHPRKLNL